MKRKIAGAKRTTIRVGCNTFPYKKICDYLCVRYSSIRWSLLHLVLFPAGLQALILAFAVTGRAQGGPPMITDDTGTVPKGHFEINTAFTLEVGEHGRVWGAPLID